MVASENSEKNLELNPKSEENKAMEIDTIEKNEASLVSDGEQKKINFFKRNQIGVTVFCAILGLRYVWIIQSARIDLDYIAALVSILFDSPIALIIACLAQWISNKFKKKKKC